MAIKKRSINVDTNHTDYPHYQSTFNDSNPNNFSHQSNLPTNGNLKTITLEDCDQAVFSEFHNRFRIAQHDMPLIVLDAELPSLKEQNYRQFDKQKDYINGPYFTMFRKESRGKYRTNPSFKPVVYTIPVSTADGIIYEDWICEAPLAYDLIYEFKFITNYREYNNAFEQQFRAYFRNKRNIIIVHNERFSIGPEDYKNFSDLEILNRDSANKKTYYVSTYTLVLDCFIRDTSTMQKRQRPNKMLMQMKITDGVQTIATKEEVNIKGKYPQNNKPL